MQDVRDRPAVRVLLSILPGSMAGEGVGQWENTSVTEPTKREVKTAAPSLRILRVHYRTAGTSSLRTALC